MPKLPPKKKRISSDEDPIRAFLLGISDDLFPQIDHPAVDQEAFRRALDESMRAAAVEGGFIRYPDRKPKDVYYGRPPFFADFADFIAEFGPLPGSGTRPCDRCQEVDLSSDEELERGWCDGCEEIEHLDYYEANLATVCDVCEEKYEDHPEHPLVDWCVLLCNGDAVKSREDIRYIGGWDDEGGFPTTKGSK